MAVNIPYTKGVRTRYRNILENEIVSGQKLLQNLEFAAEENTLEVTKCIERLKTFSTKLENQSEKLAAALGEDDADLIDELVEKDGKLVSEAMDCYLDLENLKQRLVSLPDKESDRILLLQKDIQNISVNQEKQQQELLIQQETMKKQLSVKLPKLDMVSFNGDKLKWIEFWDFFECTIHNNDKLSNVEKFSYLKSKLTGEARSSIAGLSLTNENYKVAIDILKERFGKIQEVIDLHYNQMINLQPASNRTSSLRYLMDKVDRHLRSLEVLHQNINQDVFVSMLRSKLPEEVLLLLEIQNGANKPWTIFSLRDRLNDYVVARERAEKQFKQTDSKNNVNNFGNRRPTSTRFFRTSNLNPKSRDFVPSSNSSAEALMTTVKSGTVKSYSDKCRYCEKTHWSDECPKYRTIEARKKQLAGSCFKCLKVGHSSDECKRSRMCVHCGELNSHHRSLCPKKFKVDSSSVLFAGKFNDFSQQINIVKECSGVSSSSTQGVDSKDNVLISSGEVVLMQTAKTEVMKPDSSTSHQVRIFLDSGSQRSYITKDFAEKLGLKGKQDEELKLVTFGSEKPKVIKTTSAQLCIKLNNNKYLDISVNIVPIICSTIQRKSVKSDLLNDLHHLVQSIDLADDLPLQDESSTVELLIGNDYYLDIILLQRIEIQPGLYLMASKLGWILTGRTNEVEENSNNVNMLILTHGTNITKTSIFTNVDPVLPTQPDLEDFWNIETIGIMDNPKKVDDSKAMQNFQETLVFKDGRYQVTWPWKDEVPDLPVNRELALGRLRSSVLRMKNKPELMKKYNCVIQEQLNKGVIEKVENTNNGDLRHYIPHHAVINPLKPTTQLRIVYDASAKTNSVKQSLNECLYRGPVMLHDLCGILLRFRLQKVAVVADIEKAFLQIGLQPNQRDVTRFIWLKNCEKAIFDNTNLQEYRFCRVPFGVISSPFLLGATIETHLDSFNDELSNKLKRDIYVDNLITGTESPVKAIELYSKTKSIFREASMNIREWISNSDEVNNFIPCEDKAETTSAKVLGHVWNVENESIKLKSPDKKIVSKEVTKRNVLKEIASIFDPLGLFSPILLRGKILLQELWKMGLHWDETIDDTMTDIWISVKSDLDHISDYQIPRYIGIHGSQGVKYALLCFCDASANAYSAVVYLHQQQANETNVSLIFSKTRLAPLKRMTIPRLELMAVLIGVRCIEFVKSQLELPIDTTFLWTDSQCVLKWISSNKDLSVFVKNRVSEIKSHDIEFCYVNTKENPADIATRGVTLQMLFGNQL